MSNHFLEYDISDKTFIQGMTTTLVWVKYAVKNVALTRKYFIDLYLCCNAFIYHRYQLPIRPMPPEVLDFGG